MNGDPAIEGGNIDLELESSAADLQAPDQVGGLGATRSMQSVTNLAWSHASAPHSNSRQLRRLLGRRDTAGATDKPTDDTSVQPAPVKQPAALRLEPGSKELVLARPLDKEGAEGESSLVINVRCRPRAVKGSSQWPNAIGTQTRRSYTTIPIRLIVTDANDHAPEFVGQQPYVISLSETTPANSALQSRDIQALDKDSAGPHSTIHYHVLEHSGAPLASWPLNLSVESAARRQNWSSLAQNFAFTNPLEPILWLTNSLDYESLPAPSFMLTIVAQDQAEPEPLQSTAQVQINVLGE